MYSQFANKYPISKTLRFELIPQGRTLEYIEKNGILTEDENRVKAYKAVKEIIDDYHRKHIDDTLKTVSLEGIDKFFELYLNDSSNKDELEITAQTLRTQVANFPKSPKEKYNRLFSKDLIEKDLPAWVENDKEKE